MTTFNSNLLERLICYKYLLIQIQGQDILLTLPIYKKYCIVQSIYTPCGGLYSPEACRLAPFISRSQSNLRDWAIVQVLCIHAPILKIGNVLIYDDKIRQNIHLYNVSIKIESLTSQKL